MHPFLSQCSFGLLFSLLFQSLFVAPKRWDINTELFSPNDINTELFSPNDINTELFSPNDINTEPFSPDDINTELFSPDDINTELFSPDDINTELFSPDDINTEQRSLEAIITAAEYTYLMSVDLVSANGETMSTNATLDTGSDLIWLKSTNCTGDIYGYCKDSTGKTDCKPCCKYCDKYCCDLSELPLPKGQENQPPCSKCTCSYNTSYADNFTTEGNLTMSKISMNGKKPYSIWFGVPTVTHGNTEPKSAGIVGLGQGTLSLFKQLKRVAQLSLSFSYCLPPSKSPSPTKLRIGGQAITSDKSVNLVSHKNCSNRYCVNITEISFNDGKPTDNIKVSGKNRVLLIDTGTTLTYFRKKLFNDFIKKVKHLGVGDSKELGDYPHCFEKEKENAEKLKSVSLKFNDKISIQLDPINYFVDNEYEGKKYSCLTVMEEENESMPNILGSWAQVNFKVVIGDFDKGEKTGSVSFDKKVCAEEHKEEQVLDSQE